MDSEKLHLAIMSKKDWGNKLSENDSFYRLLFKLDKIRENDKELSIENTNWLFASYQKWFEKVEQMLEECMEDNAGNREAHEYGEQLKVDILNHVHEIITESKLEQKDLINDLTVKADIEKVGIARAEEIKVKNMET